MTALFSGLQGPPHKYQLCRIVILLSCRGDKSAKPDSHGADAPVELPLTALSDRMTHTPPSSTHIHQQTHGHSIEGGRTPVFLG